MKKIFLFESLSYTSYMRTRREEMMKTKQLRLYDFFGNEKRNNENKVLVFGRLQAKKSFRPREADT